MSRKIVLALTLIIVLFGVLGIALMVQEGKARFSASNDETLYFQRDYAMDGWLMNTTETTGSVTWEADLGDGPRFVSPTLVSDFTYENISVTFYHDCWDDRDREFYVQIGWYDAVNVTHTFMPIAAIISKQTYVTTVSTKSFLSLTSQQRLWVRLSISGSTPMYWGDSIRKSHVSYYGVANYIPEFPSFIILPLFMIATLLAVIIYRRKYAR